jgi:hypothetical protein
MRLWLCIGVVAACANEAPPAPVASASAATDDEPLTKGTEIVAAVGAVSFREGRVLTIAGDEVTFEHGRADPKTGAKPQQKVDRARVWRIGRSLDVAAGEHLVCRVAPTMWLPCKVEGREQADFRVSDAFGKSHRLAATDMVLPDEARRKAIATFLERENKHRAFDEAFEAAGSPARPDGWRAAIHYDGQAFPDRDVPLSGMAPLPSEPADTAAGSFVLVKPTDPSERWEHAKVLRVDGSFAEVVNRNDDKRKVARADLVPIVSSATRDRKREQ